MDLILNWAVTLSLAATLSIKGTISTWVNILSNTQISAVILGVICAHYMNLWTPLFIVYIPRSYPSSRKKS